MKWNSLTSIRKILLCLLVVLSLLAVFRLFFFEYRLLNYPYPWELREALQFHHGILLSEGKSLYSLHPDPPVVLEPYGPVNPFLLSGVIKIFGKNLAGPRLLSFLSFMILLMLVAAAVYRLTHQWLYVVIAIGVNSFILSWVQWLLLCRPDSLGGLLLFASLFIHWLYPYKRMAILAGLLLILLAFFTKVYFVLGLLFVPLNYWIFHRDRRMAVLYFLAGTTLLFVSVAAINIQTKGLYHLFTFVLLSKWVTYSLEHLLDALTGLLKYFLPFFILILYSVIKRDFRYREINIFWIAITVGIPIFSFLLLNTGAETYYWYAVIPALTVAGFDVLNRELNREKSPVGVAMLLLLFCLMTNKMIISETIKNGMFFPSDQLAAKWKPIANIFERVQDPILTDDATAVLAIQTGKRLHREGLGYLNIKNGIAETLHFKFRDIDEEIAKRNFALIINPENESLVEKFYCLDQVYEVPVQLGKAYSLKMFLPCQSGGK